MSISNLPQGWRLDPDVAQVPGVHYVWAITDTGERVAWQGGPIVLCPTCLDDHEKRIDCMTCSGRGQVDSIPYAERPWDGVIANLYLGGVHCQLPGTDGAGNALPESNFDVVLSLFHAPGYEPTGRGPSGYEVEHHEYRIADADLDPEHHGNLRYLAQRVSSDVERGKRVLVRCQAGLNRSAMIVGLVLIEQGWTVDDALAKMREVRSPFVLFNQSFVEFLRTVEAAS